MNSFRLNCTKDEAIEWLNKACDNNFVVVDKNNIVLSSYNYKGLVYFRYMSSLENISGFIDFHNDTCSINLWKKDGAIQIKVPKIFNVVDILNNCYLCCKCNNYSDKEVRTYNYSEIICYDCFNKIMEAI